MKLSRLLFCILLLCHLSSVSAQSMVKPYDVSMEEVEKQARFVSHLIESSSLALKLKESNDDNVKSLYRVAKELYKNSLNYMDKGNSSAAAESLFHAKGMMFRAAKLAGKQEVEKDTDQQIFELRLKSVNALLDAMQRIGEEKHIQAKTTQIKNKADTEIAAAKKLMESGETIRARKTLDTIYIYVKTVVTDLRDGDTLVRSLHFKTKKDEYLYELDRNETHSMLVTLLLTEKLKDPKARARAQKFLDKAEGLKQKAQESAEKGDYDKAVENFEESTRQIIRAIRSSGFFIPG